MTDKFSYKNTDFILKPGSDQALINRIEKYESFLSALCSKEYFFQKAAIYEVLKYFLNDKYSNLWDLAKEGYGTNERLRQRFDSEDKYRSHLQLPEKKSCSIDLATGTGKSFAIYGLAQIMLAEGLVDQVLVLCPSRTIEAGLTEKFELLAANEVLRKLLPASSALANPRIINATKTIRKGDICIENVHAVYKNTGSSIYDSLKGKGSRTLVLNDEAHHVFNKIIGTGDDAAFKQWKNFLLHKDYGFHYIVNFSGTPYIGQDYFLDVLYRYSLKSGMEDRVIKSVEYLIEVGDEKKMKGFQEVWENHVENKRRYEKIKPLTIVVTADIAKCVEVWGELVKFIASKEKISVEEARKKAIWVVSGIPSKMSASGKRIYKVVSKPEKEREKNLLLLKEVDELQNPVEWIVSVAMLTEGWDVKNVFQIVPHDSRAFNSKLLIAQVLGRGLRIPEVYRGEEGIKVRVFNHAKFSAHIKNLVDEILEIEDRFSWFPADSKGKYNFKLHNLNYKKDEEFIQKKVQRVKFSERINLGPQSRSVQDYNVYRDVRTGEETTSKYSIDTIAFSLSAAASDIWTMLAAYDAEENTKFRLKYTKTKIKKILSNNLPAGADFISYENLNKAKAAFGKLFDVGGVFSFLKNRADELTMLSTRDISRQSVSASALKRESMCFYSEGTESTLEGDEKETFRQILENEEDYKIKRVEESELMTPLNCLVVSFEPERKFAKSLLENADLFDSFIKSPDKSFYAIPYSFKKGTHMKYLNFNPDFFFRKGDDILVVEIKKDDDESKENIAKNRDAKKHFEIVNRHLNSRKYFFYFLSPEDYLEFFQAVRDGRYSTFRSSLSQSLEA